jgi:hypothetical protein
MPETQDIQSAESLNQAVSALNIEAVSAQSLCKIYKDHKKLVDDLIDTIKGLPIYGDAASTVIKLALKLLCP